MNLTADPDPQSWLAKEPTWLDPCIARLNGERSTYAAVDEGHWIVAAEAGGTLTQAGRILRIRSDLDSTTIYFDHVHTFRTSGTVSGLGLTLPTGPIARLRPEDLTSIFALDGISITDVPLVQNVAYVRDLLEIAVRDDLLGPAGGPHELIKDMSVRDRYLVGKLAPRRPSDTDAVAVEPASGADEIRDIEDERAAPIHEPGAEFASVSGRVEPEDDALDEIDTTNNQSLVPSSMGFTFCVAPGVESLAADVQWGRYERVPSDEHDVVKTRRNRATSREEETKVKVWRRIPCGGPVLLPLKDGSIRPATPDHDQPEVRLQGTIRTNAQGERLVTLFLVNGQLEPDDNKDRAWLFQPEIAVAAPEGAADPSIFRRRPSNEIIVDDPERDRLALIYRNRLEFAVGHGVSVHADTTPDDSARASHLRTEIIPRYEVAVTETPGLDTDDRPAMRRMVDEGWLDMGRLAEMEPPQLREALLCLVDDYAVWIGEQRTRLTAEITGFDEPGKDVIARCEETLRRLREGMDT
ncbi:MAG: hypothetical protein O9272_04475, partial [Brevundimonas sp.]|nr:hypothetical protein [Brevundimonas sp.]